MRSLERIVAQLPWCSSADRHVCHTQNYWHSCVFCDAAYVYQILQQSLDMCRNIKSVDDLQSTLILADYAGCFVTYLPAFSRCSFSHGARQHEISAVVIAPHINSCSSSCRAVCVCWLFVSNSSICSIQYDSAKRFVG